MELQRRHQADDAFGHERRCFDQCSAGIDRAIGELIESARRTHDDPVRTRRASVSGPIRWAEKSLSRIEERAPSSLRAWARWVLVIANVRFPLLIGQHSRGFITYAGSVNFSSSLTP